MRGIPNTWWFGEKVDTAKTIANTDAEAPIVIAYSESLLKTGNKLYLTNTKMNIIYIIMKVSILKKLYLHLKKLKVNRIFQNLKIKYVMV